MKAGRLFAGLAVALSLAAAAPSALAEEYRLKFGTLAPDNTPWSEILKEFQKRVQKESKGRLKVKLYLGGQLGDERAMLEKIQFGQLTGGGFSTGGMSSRVPELQLLELPFLFDSNEEADHILDVVVRDYMAKRFEEEGLYLYIWAENGWVDFGSKKASIASADDLKGQKFFSQESDVQISFWKSVGAPHNVLPVTEVLTALQSGLVDAYATTPVYALGAQWHTQTRYWTDSNHVYQPAAVVWDMKFWKELPDDLKQVILAERDGLQARARKDVRGIDEGILDGFVKDAKIDVRKLSPEAREELRRRTAGVADDLIGRGIFKRELYDQVKAALAELRAKKAGAPPPGEGKKS